jgi:dipeptidyl aminopeptidase/acylaminoacyl peptidase
VTATTTGPDPDLVGYGIALSRDGAVVRERTVPANGRINLSDLVTGSYTYEIDRVDGNCAVTGGASGSVSIVRAQTTNLAVNVSCAAVATSLVVSVTTTGEDPDDTGYRLRANLQEPIDVAPTDHYTIDVTARARALRLLGVAPNCAVTPRLAVIDASTHDGSTIAFTVTCVAEELMTFSKPSAAGDSDIHVGEISTGDIRRVLTLPGEQGDAQWGSDGETLAFLQDGDVFTVQTDGSGLQPVTSGLEAVTFDWASDGSSIVFDRILADTVTQIFSVDGDGSNEVQLTDRIGFDVLPALSPDGSRIAFFSDRSGAFEVHVMNADGTGVAQLTTDAITDDGVPIAGIAWSPDGSMLAYTGATAETLGDVHVVNGDGTDQRVLVGTDAAESAPAWSPDGTRIAFVRGGNILAIDVDGTGLESLFDTPLDETAPDWR